MNVLDDFVCWIILICVYPLTVAEKLLFENFKIFMGKPLKEVQFY